MESAILISSSVNPGRFFPQPLFLRRRLAAVAAASAIVLSSLFRFNNCGIDPFRKQWTSTRNIAFRAPAEKIESEKQRRRKNAVFGRREAEAARTSLTSKATKEMLLAVREHQM